MYEALRKELKEMLKALSVTKLTEKEKLLKRKEQETMPSRVIPFAIRKRRLPETPHIKKVCIFCGDSFLAYRSTARYDTMKCRRLWNYWNSPGYRERRNRMKREKHALRKLMKKLDSKF